MSKVITVHNVGKMVESREKHVNERGLLVELFKYDYPGCQGLRFCRQVNLFTVEPGRTKAGHKHPNTRETWIIVRGTGTMRLEYPDGLKAKVEYRVTRDDDALVVCLPPGTGHDITADTFTLCVYDTDRLYDPDDRDEEPWEWEA